MRLKNRPSNVPWGLLTLYLLLAGCPSVLPPQERTLTPGSTITVQLTEEERLVLRLPENSGTGYVWQLVDELPACVRQVGKPNSVADHPGIPGSSGTATFTFQGVEPGYDTLRFEYVRPWEESSQTNEVTTVNVSVGS